MLNKKTLPSIKRSASSVGTRGKQSKMTGHPLASKFKREENPSQALSHRSSEKILIAMPKKKLKKKTKKPPKPQVKKLNAKTALKSHDAYSPNSHHSKNTKFSNRSQSPQYSG